jgi:hypothetical protein
MLKPLKYSADVLLELLAGRCGARVHKQLADPFHCWVLLREPTSGAAASTKIVT